MFVNSNSCNCYEEKSNGYLTTTNDVSKRWAFPSAQWCLSSDRRLEWSYGSLIDAALFTGLLPTSCPDLQILDDSLLDGYFRFRVISPKDGSTVGEVTLYCVMTAHPAESFLPLPSGGATNYASSDARSPLYYNACAQFSSIYQNHGRTEFDMIKVIPATRGKVWSTQIARFMGPTWVLTAPDGPHVGPMNLALKEYTLCHVPGFPCYYVKIPDFSGVTIHHGDFGLEVNKDQNWVYPVIWNITSLTGQCAFITTYVTVKLVPMHLYLQIAAYVI